MYSTCVSFKLCEFIWQGILLETFAIYLFINQFTCDKFHAWFEKAMNAKYCQTCVFWYVLKSEISLHEWPIFFIGDIGDKYQVYMVYEVYMEVYWLNQHKYENWCLGSSWEWRTTAHTVETTAQVMICSWSAHLPIFVAFIQGDVFHWYLDIRN